MTGPDPDRAPTPTPTPTPATTATVAAQATEPAFELEGNREDETFNLRPRTDLHRPIPEDQRKVSQNVYEARNILKLLKTDGAFATTGTYEEFMTRVVQAGRAGCVTPYVDTLLANGALEQIRADIVRRVGTPLAYHYLRSLAWWAVGGAVLSAAIIIVGGRMMVPIIEPYGWVVIGAMVGAWFSVAASRRQIAFETIPDYLDRKYEPFVRILFVVLAALAFALFLDLGILSIKIGNTDLAHFKTSVGVALVLGFVAGIGERALSVQLMERAQKVLNPSRS